MEKDKPPQLVTPASVKAIISRIEAAQLTRTQEVTPGMRVLPFCWDLMWKVGTDPIFGQDSSAEPSGVLGSSAGWVYRQISAKYLPPSLGLWRVSWNQPPPPPPEAKMGPGRGHATGKT